MDLLTPVPHFRLFAGWTTAVVAGTQAAALDCEVEGRCLKWQSARQEEHGSLVIMELLY